MNEDMVIGIILGIMSGVLISALIIQICEKTTVVLTGSETGREYVIRKSNIRACRELEDKLTLVTLKEPIAHQSGKTTTQMIVKDHHRYIVR